jgi:hypothetical protein
MDNLYRKEKIQAVKAMLEVLAAKRLYDIDLSFVDYEATVNLIIEHEVMDYSEAGTLEEMSLAEMKGLLRSVYLNGAPIFAFDDLAETQRKSKAIFKMVNAGDSNMSFLTEDRSTASCVRQMKRPNMITSMDQVHVGQWLMIFIENEPRSLVQVTEVPPGGRLFFCGEWGKNQGIKEAGWLDHGMFKASELGIRPYAKGKWETASWAESVDDCDHCQ